MIVIYCQYRLVVSLQHDEQLAADARLAEELQRAPAITVVERKDDMTHCAVCGQTDVKVRACLPLTFLIVSIGVRAEDACYQLRAGRKGCCWLFSCTAHGCRCDLPDLRPDLRASPYQGTHAIV